MEWISRASTPTQDDTHLHRRQRVETQQHNTQDTEQEIRRSLQRRGGGGDRLAHTR